MTQKLSLVAIIMAVLLAAGCTVQDKSSSSAASSSSAPENGLITTGNSTTTSNAILEIPTSLKVDSSLKSRATRAGESGGMAGIFSGIPKYISMADDVKTMAKMLFTQILGSEALKTIPTNTIYAIPNENDPEAPKYIQIDSLDGNPYDWKLSLYFTSSNTSPEMSVFASFQTGLTKGRVLMSQSGSFESISNTNIIRLAKMDMTFSATAADKSMEIRFTQDLSGLIAYAQANWGGLTTEQKNALDLGQPGKVFLTCGLTNDVFTIYGTSYHPGLSVLGDLNGSQGNFGPGRDMYMFKAKAQLNPDGSDVGAKLYLALPLTNRSDIGAVYDEDSIGALFTDYTVNQINGQITNMSESGQIMIMDMVLGLTPLVTDYPSILQVHYDQFTNYVQTSGDTNFGGLATTPYSSLNAYYISLASGNQQKLGIMGAMHLVTNKTILSNHGYTLSEAEILAFAAKTNAVDANLQSFKDSIVSINSMINPAFFTPASGFLGTYNVSNATFYNYNPTNYTLSAGTAPSAFSGLNALDLSAVTGYVPLDVFNAVITNQ